MSEENEQLKQPTVASVAAAAMTPSAQAAAGRVTEMHPRLLESMDVLVTRTENIGKLQRELMVVKGPGKLHTFEHSREWVEVEQVDGELRDRRS